ncbi:MAG: hypothetical protein NT010_16935 [Proteobacteria bacterium]|nr:hypothetical protein [Pseudomonadota bacterium]
MAGDTQESSGYSMEIFEEDVKAYAFFYNNKGEFVKEIHINKSINNGSRRQEAKL